MKDVMYKPMQLNSVLQLLKFLPIESYYYFDSVEIDEDIDIEKLDHHSNNHRENRSMARGEEFSKDEREECHSP